MKNFVSKIIFISIFIASLSNASALVGLDYILFTDKNTVETNTSTNSSKTMYSLNIQFTLNSKKSLYFGWSLYNITTKDEVNEQKSNYSTQDMGPSFRYEFGRGGIYFVNFVYGIQTKTGFDIGADAEEWLGTNYIFQFGVSPEISESFNVCFAFNYFSGSTKTKVVSDVQTDVAYSKAFMTPTIGLLYKW